MGELTLESDLSVSPIASSGALGEIETAGGMPVVVFLFSGCF
jgi:hypothetical protein